MLPTPEYIISTLTERYGNFKWQPRLNALDELIFTILTQHTTDKNAEKAFNNLKQLGTWQKIANTDLNTITQLIRTGGLATQKSKTIKRALEEIQNTRGSLDLEWLAELEWQTAREWLMQIPGVGIKTASVVMSFSFGAPAIPVDTHVLRVSKRLGLLQQNCTADKAHHIIEALVDKEQTFKFHVLLITHGRETCKARNPLCKHCPLYSQCAYVNT